MKSTSKPTQYDKKQDAKIRRIQSAIESKQSPAVLTPTNITSTASIFILNGVAQGTTSQTRIGDKIRMTSLAINYAWRRSDDPQLCRVAIVYDKQVNTTLLLETELWETLANPLSMREWDNRKRFRVLHDKIYTFDSAFRDTLVKKLYLKIPAKYSRVQYTGTGSLVGNIISGGLFVVLISDSGASAHPTFQFVSRLNFLDS